MKILFVTLWALETNTSVSKSNYGILRGLRELGHDVTILMPTIDEKLSYYDDTYSLDGFSVERIKNENIGQQVANISSNAGGIKKRVIDVAREIYTKCKIFDRTKLLLKEAKSFSKYDEYFDIVISTSDPKTSHLFVSEMIKHGLKYGRWVQHWGDPLAGDISRTSIHPNFLLEYMEKKIIRNAGRIVYVSPFTLEAQKERYIKIASRMMFVPLPSDEVDENVQVNKTEKLHERLKVVYLGDYSSRIRNIMPLYEACSVLDSVELTIAGNTDLKLESKKNIKVMQRIPQKDAKRLEEEADVIVSVGNLNGNQIPGKIYYAASSNKTILVAVDGEDKARMNEYLSSFNRFTCCDNTKESLIDAMVMLTKGERGNYKTPDALLAKNVVACMLK